MTDRTGLAHAYSLPRGSVSDERRAAVIDDACKLLPPPFALVVAAEPQPFAQAIFDFETPKMTDGRLVLIGDAAFVARPHTAMGVAKVAGDVMALAELLGGATVSEALVLYERQRSRFGRSVVDYGRRLGASLRS